MRWLKSLFKKEEHKEPSKSVILENSNLETWFLDEIKENTSNIRERLENTQKILKEQKAIISQNIIDIPVDSNLTIQLNSLMAEFYLADSITESTKIVEDLVEKIEKFISNNSKEKMKLFESFSTQISQIYGAIDIVYSQLQTLNDDLQEKKEDIQFLSSILSDISQFISKIQEKDDLNKKVALWDQKIESAKALKERSDRDILKLESKGFVDKNYNLIEEKKQNQANYEKVINEVEKSFSSIKPVLINYSKIALENPQFVQAYAIEPSSTLIKDEGLAIKNILHSMHIALEQGSIVGLAEHGPKIRELTTKCESLRSKLVSATQMRGSIMKRVNMARGLFEVEDALYKQKHSTEHLSKAQEEKDKILHKINELSVDFYKKKLEQNINAALGVEVNII